jgi:hypothetical protein
MKAFSRIGALSLLLIGSLTGPASAAQDCKKIHGLIVDAQVVEGCDSPNKFCAAGVVNGNHAFNGTTYFRMDGVVRGPATQPGSIATSGVLTYTFDNGTLTVRESGLSGLSESGQGYFTAFQTVLSGTGDYAGATGHLWVAGRNVESHFESDISGVICLP